MMYSRGEGRPAGLVVKIVRRACVCRSSFDDDDDDDDDDRRPVVPLPDGVASMSSHRHYQQQSVGRQRRSLSSATSAAAAAAWEDDAWKIDSDDEEFVKASKVASGSAEGSGTGSAERGLNLLSIEKKSQERQSESARSAVSLRKEEASTRAGDHYSSSAQHHNGKGNGHWMLVERSGSGGSVQAVKPVASTLDGGNGRTTESALDDGEDESATTTRKKSLSTRDETINTIYDDLEHVLKDPTIMLDRLRHERRPSSSSSHRRITEETAKKTAQQESRSKELDGDRRRSRPTIDTTNAIVAVDGIVTNLPASSDQLDPSNLDVVPTQDVVLLASSGVLERRRSVRSERRKARFIRCLSEDVVPMDELKTLSWAGVPDEMRPIVWMLLLGYLPTNRGVRAETLARKRAEYTSGVRNTFQRGKEELDQATWHQIHIDVPRTNPGIPLWQREATQRALERILYVWAIRHPVCGYVQGINDLATPFFEVFLGAYISSDAEQYDITLLPTHALEAIEADTFWCLSKLLDGIQDNYRPGQPGIHEQVEQMGKLVSRINPALHRHLEAQSVEYMQFAFRWINCLLMRELSVRNIVRMWDSYLAEGPNAFSEFHLFVCAAFLDRWSVDLEKMDFQGIIMFLQSLPTHSWTAADTELLLADAFVKKSLFGGTAHLTN